MNYWKWNIPIRKSPYDSGASDNFNLAEKLCLSVVELDLVRDFAKLNTIEKTVAVKAGDVEIINPWNNDGKNELSDLQVWRRWNTEALAEYCSKALDHIGGRR